MVSCVRTKAPALYIKPIIREMLNQQTILKTLAYWDKPFSDPNAFFCMASLASVSSWVSLHSRSSKGPGQASLPFGPWAGLWSLEATFWPGVAIQCCQFLQVFSEPENERWEMETEKKWQGMRGKHRITHQCVLASLSNHLLISRSSGQGKSVLWLLIDQPAHQKEKSEENTHFQIERT